MTTKIKKETHPAIKKSSSSIRVPKAILILIAVVLLTLPTPTLQQRSRTSTTTSASSGCRVSSNGRCLACQDSYYLAGSICFPCETGCKTCISSTQCQACLEEKYYTDPSSTTFKKNCKPCLSGCKTCKNDDVCEVCLILYNKSDDSKTCTLSGTGLLLILTFALLPCCCYICCCAAVIFCISRGNRSHRKVHTMGVVSRPAYVGVPPVHGGGFAPNVAPAYAAPAGPTPGSIPPIMNIDVGRPTHNNVSHAAPYNPTGGMAQPYRPLNLNPNSPGKGAFQPAF